MKKTKEKQFTEMICDKCGYEWTTASEKANVTCPNCLLKVKKIKKGGKTK